MTQDDSLWPITADQGAAMMPGMRVGMGGGSQQQSSSGSGKLIPGVNIFGMLSSMMPFLQNTPYAWEASAKGVPNGGNAIFY